MSIPAVPVAMNGRRSLLVAVACTALPGVIQAAAPAAPPELLALLPDARLQGSGRMRHFGLHIYDARLWVGPQFDPARYADLPFALELEYARSFDGVQIAERSLVEMRRIEEPSPADASTWLAAMKQTFPDVSAGQRVTGLNQPGRGATFLADRRALGEILDSAFARQFFAIWLSPRTSEPRLRRELLGLG
jgi:hypothetical protein